MARVRFIVHKTWLVENPPADLDAAIDRAIAMSGMTATRVGDRLELAGGSSFKVKALGAKLTADSDLPRVGSVERSAASGELATERITVHLEDRLNSAVMDPPIKKKYDRVFQGFASSVEAALSTAAPQTETPTQTQTGTQPQTAGADAAAGSSHIPGSPREPIVRAAGWWTDVRLGTIVRACHVAGAQRQDIGALIATEAGIAFTGHPKGGCRWEDLAEIEVIELRQNETSGRLLRRCVRLTSQDGETGEFWIRGKAEPTLVYAIETLKRESA